MIVQKLCSNERSIKTIIKKNSRLFQPCQSAAKNNESALVFQYFLERSRKMKFPCGMGTALFACNQIRRGPVICDLDSGI